MKNKYSVKKIAYGLACIGIFTGIAAVLIKSDDMQELAGLWIYGCIFVATVCEIIEWWKE